MKLLLILALSGCATLGPLADRLAHCAPSPFELAELVAHILLTGRIDWEHELDSLAQKYGPELVKCAAAELADEWNEKGASSVEHGALYGKGLHGGWTEGQYDAAQRRALSYSTR